MEQKELMKEFSRRMDELAEWLKANSQDNYNVMFAFVAMGEDDKHWQEGDKWATHTQLAGLMRRNSDVADIINQAANAYKIIKRHEVMQSMLR